MLSDPEEPFEMFGFWKKKGSADSYAVGQVVGKQLIKILVDLINEKMPELLQLYLDTLSKKLAEAHGDKVKLQLAWDGFRASLVAVPSIVERTIRDQYSELFCVLERARGGSSYSWYHKKRSD